MILSRTHAQAIARGQKTQLRRPYSAEPPFARGRQVVQFERPRTYDDAPAKDIDDTTVRDVECHVMILTQDLATLGDMTEDDARAEGFTPGAGVTALYRYRQWWQETYGGWRDQREVWVVRFQLDDADRPRYMLPAAGYTEAPSRALDNVEVVVQTGTGPRRMEMAVESVSDTELERFAGEAAADRERRRRREELDRRALSFEERLTRARREARTHGVDLARQEARVLDALKAKDRGRVVAGLESMERKIQSRAA